MKEFTLNLQNILKELVVNSVEADSKNIKINLTKYDKNIEVIDDGSGIQESQFENLGKKRDVGSDAQ